MSVSGWLEHCHTVCGFFWIKPVDFGKAVSDILPSSTQLPDIILTCFNFSFFHALCNSGNIFDGAYWSGSIENTLSHVVCPTRVTQRASIGYFSAVLYMMLQTGASHFCSHYSSKR